MSGRDARRSRWLKSFNRAAGGAFEWQHWYWLLTGVFDFSIRTEADVEERLARFRLHSSTARV